MAELCWTFWRSCGCNSTMRPKQLRKLLDAVQRWKSGRQIDPPSQSESRIDDLQKFQVLMKVDSRIRPRPINSTVNYQRTMHSASVGRPVGCLKAALRRVRFQKTYQRSFATTAPVSVGNPFSGRQRTFKDSKLGRRSQ